MTGHIIRNLNDLDSPWMPIRGFEVIEERFGERTLRLKAQRLNAGDNIDELRVVAADGADHIAHLIITLTHKVQRTEKTTTEPVGSLPAGTVLDVYTLSTHQKQGIAGRLWQLARQVTEENGWPSPQHSPSRTKDGERFAQSVGGPVPPLHKGTLFLPTGKNPLRRHLLPEPQTPAPGAVGSVGS